MPKLGSKSSRIASWSVVRTIQRLQLGFPRTVSGPPTPGFRRSLCRSYTKALQELDFLVELRALIVGYPVQAAKAAGTIIPITVPGPEPRAKPTVAHSTVKMGDFGI